MLRRSKISDSIPDGNANSKIGRAIAVVIRETNKGFGASEVISHDAPTSWKDFIHRPNPRENTK